MLKVITVTTDIEATKPLINSLEKHGWDFHPILTTWRGFGTKIIETYNYLKEHPEVDAFIFCDAFDVVAFGTPDEFDEKIKGRRDKMVFSAEKNCWPVAELSEFYPYKAAHGFNYLNSGLYYATSKLFMECVEANPLEYDTDDQLYFTTVYLNWHKNNPGVYGAKYVLDNDQEIFNSHSFIAENEYTYENNRVQILGNRSIFIHSNGRTIDPKLDTILNSMIKLDQIITNEIKRTTSKLG